MPRGAAQRQAEENCGAGPFRLSKAEVVTLDRYALDGESFYRLSDRQSSSPSRFAAADVVELLAGTERTGMPSHT